VWFDRESRINCVSYYLDSSSLRLTKDEVEAMTDVQLELCILHDITNIEYRRMGMYNDTYPVIFLVLGLIVDGGVGSTNTTNTVRDVDNDTDNNSNGNSNDNIAYSVYRDPDYDGSWQLLSKADRDKLLSVYGLINEDEDEDEWIHQTPVKFMQLTNLQSAVAREVAAFYDNSFEARGYDPVQGLIYERY